MELWNLNCIEREIIMIAIYLRSKNAEKIRVKMNRQDILSSLYTPYTNEYEDYCLILKQAIEKYKDQKLVKDIPNEYEKRMMEEDPSFAENIPEYYVPGYDEAVGSKYPGKARKEFLERFKNSDPEIVKFINKYNKFYRAEIV